MNIESLSDLDLTKTLDTLALKGRENTVELLRHLMEFDSRKLFRDLGYPSLFEYCVRRLKLSESGACRRVSAARCLRENSALAEMLISGKVTLCTVATAAKSIEKKVTTLSEIAGCSTREVQSLVALSNPVPGKPREVIRPVVIERPADLIEAPRREERVTLEFSVSKDEFEVFRRIQAELSIEAGKSLSLEETLGRLMRNRKTVTRRLRVRSSDTRVVPRAVKREVYSRDGGQCSFVSEEGLRCCEKNRLQFDHIHPFAKGGLTQSSNMRLLCPAHNRLMAERNFGRDFIEARINTTSAGGS